MKAILLNAVPLKQLIKQFYMNKNYFYQEIKQRKSCSNKLDKYVTAFDYIDNILIVLSETSSGVSIISFTSIAGAPDEKKFKKRK